jgi:hypothetical protein
VLCHNASSAPCTNCTLAAADPGWNDHLLSAWQREQGQVCITRDSDLWYDEWNRMGADGPAKGDKGRKSGGSRR